MSKSSAAAFAACTALACLATIGVAHVNASTSAPATASAARSGAAAHNVHRPKIRPGKKPPRPARGGVTQFGDPLFGLDAAQLALFEAGLEEFESEETPEGGLGPTFNGNSCVACHSAAATGGASALTVTRFARVTGQQFDPLAALGGTLLQARTIDPAVQETVPAEANLVVQRLTTPLFGAGLVEAIPDEEIRRNAARRQPDGIKGRVAVVVDAASGKERVGRLGWKAQHASILAFTADAYLNEMGITNRFFAAENAPNGNAALLAQFDVVPDPEDQADPDTGRADVDALADFIRLLAPPPQRRLGASAAAGARVFEQVNCSACHTPVLFSGPSPVAALAYQPVRLYSDLLLHDMGALADGIEQGAATAREMKTAPLWGLRARGPFLHDGRAATVTDAILGHDGAGGAARRRFERLNAAHRRQLLHFLDSI